MINPQSSSTGLTEVMSQPLSVDQLSAMLRLHLLWPESRTLDPTEEANEFYLWLTHEMGQEQVAENVGTLADIKMFVSAHRKTLARARYIKSRLRDGSSDARIEPRLDVHTQVFYLVYDCEKDPGIEGRIDRGVMLDIARNGMRFESSTPIPQGAILSLTVAQVALDVRLYHLTGEVRWMSEHHDAYQIGLSIFNIEDYEDWQDFYDLTSMT